MGVGGFFIKIGISFAMIMVTQILVTVIRWDHAELTGSDLSLYGYGAAVGLFTRMSTGQRIFPDYTPKLPAPVFFVVLTIVITIVIYAVNTQYIAKKMKESHKDFKYGISCPHFWKSIKDPKTRRLWIVSLSLGMIPAALMANMIVFFG